MTPSFNLSDTIFEPVVLKVYPFGPQSYSESTALSLHVVPEQWQDVLIELPRGWDAGPLRLKPLNQPGLAEIERMEIVSEECQHVVWPSVKDFSPAGSIQVVGDAVVVPDEGRFAVCSCTPGLQLYLPELRCDGNAAQLKIRLRITKNSNFLQQAFALGGFDGYERERKRLLLELRTAQAERLLVLADLRQLAAENNILLLDESRTEVQKLKEELAREKEIRQGMLTSVSWRITSPIRGFMERLRARRSQ